ncbi:MAG: glycosyltransferase [Patescibacteria group bacterium]
MPKKVSILIISYNRKSLLQKNLEAIDKQKFEGNLEVIIVDNGSTDGTAKMLDDKITGGNKFVFKYFKMSRMGVADARNLTIAHSRGDILIFLDDDSVIQNDDYVEKIVESFKENGIGIVAGRTVDFYSGVMRLIKAGDPPEIDFDNPAGLKKTVGVPTKNAAFLREAVHRVGGFNPLFKYACEEDVDMCIRILNFGYKLTFNNEALVYHYPVYTFRGYVKKSYFRGFSQGAFRSIYPSSGSRFFLLKAAISPLLAIRNFIKKTKVCFAQKLFTKAILKELSLMFGWISFSYAALYWGEANYRIKMFFSLLKIKIKLLKDFNDYLIELAKYYIKNVFFPYRKTFLLYLTNRCNQRCQHCFYSQDINKNIQELSLGDLGRIAGNYYRDTNINRLFAGNICQDFTGGEPFLRDDLLEIISLFKTAGVRHFQINTNGMMTDKIVNLSQELLKQNVSFKIIISVDGLEKTHNKIRNTPKAFQKTVQTIKELKSIGAAVGAIITINKLNYGEIGEVVKFLNNDFNIEPGLQLIRGSSHSNASVEVKDAADPLEKDILITKDIIPEIRDILYKIYLQKSVGSPFRVAEFARKFTYLQSHLDIMESKKRLFNCVAGKSMGVIYQNGDVALCEFYKPIGNLKEVDFDLPLLWGNAEARKQRASIKKCFCHHDCFINTEYNLRFAGHLIFNIGKFAVPALKNYKLNQ